MLITRLFILCSSISVLHHFWFCISLFPSRGSKLEHIYIYKRKEKRGKTEKGGNLGDAVVGPSSFQYDGYYPPDGLIMRFKKAQMAHVHRVCTVQIKFLP